MTKKLLTAVMLFWMLAPGVAKCQTLRIGIENPVNGAQVPWRPCVTLTTSDDRAHLVVVLHPLSQPGAFYVEPAVSPQGPGKAETMVYVGEPQQGLAERFEIKAVANPQPSLEENEVLDSWPVGDAESPAVEVERVAQAPDGCGGFHPTPRQATSLAASAPLPPPADVTALPASPSPIGQFLAVHEAARVTQFVGLGIILGLFWLWVLLAVLRHRAQIALATTTTVTLKLFDAVSKAAQWCADKAVQVCITVKNLGVSWVRQIWSVRGFSGDLGQVAMRVLAVPLLFLCLIFAFYADATVILPGLNPIFGVEESMQQTGGVVGALLRASRPANSGNPAPDAKAGNRTNPIPGLYRLLADGFTNLWSRHTLGFLAICLAFIETMLGAVFFWNLTLEETAKLRPLEIFRQRPLVAACFVALDLALAVLAANRGYQLSPKDMSWPMPTLVSGGLALLMPWILGFSLHFGWKCAAEIAGLGKAIVGISLLTAVALAAIALGTAALFAVLLIVAVVLAACCLVCVAIAAYALSADMTGEAVRLLLNRPEFRKVGPATAMAALSAIVALLAGGYLMRGAL